MKDKEKCFICNKDITKQLPKIDVNGNYCNDCYLDKCKKELEEKQIEEMSDIIFNSKYKNDYISPLKGANELYNAGYRKLPKDSVVLSTEEWKQIKNSLYYNKEELEKKLQRERKKTVKEILQKVKEKALSHCRTINCYELKFIEETIDELLEEYVK